MSTRDRLDSLAEHVPTVDTEIEAPDAFAILAGILTIDIGAELAFAREPTIFWGIASAYVFGAAIVLVLAGVTDVDVRRWGRPLAGGAFLAIMTAVAITYLTIRGVPIQTDTMGFTQRAAEAVLAGKSPYTVSMVGAFQWPTPALMGGEILSFSYPMGAALWTAPFAFFLDDGARLGVAVATAAAGAILIWHLPHDLAPLGLASMTVGNFALWGVQDLTDPLWVAPLLGALVMWPWSAVGRDSLRSSAVLLGVAASMKQQPWFCGPFLTLWVLQERGLRSAARYVGVAVGTFTVIQVPSLALAPQATVKGLFINLTGGGFDLVHLGVGLSALTLSGAYPIAKGAHTGLLAVAGLTGLAGYWTRFDTVRWAAWVAWGPLLFFNYRSLANYFITLAPVAVLILAAKRGEGQ